ncbi:unnamed protein product [Hyaloperonospora brassicae]|nr:unnamed protein product [Hyaloperonospora brassicae]
MKRRHYASIESLRGTLPRYWHWIQVLDNSFFARQLLRAGMVLSAALIAGCLFFSAFVQPWLDDNRDADDFDDCNTVASFAYLIFKTLPATIALTLPGSGLRLFKPFEREDAEPHGLSTAASQSESTTSTPLDPDDTRDTMRVATIRRGVVFQLCEVLAVLLLFGHAALGLYFLYVLSSGALDSCSSVATQAFALGAAASATGLFTVLGAFARYREHVKMQLGAFTENDQTGARRRGTDRLQRPETLDTAAKRIAVVRTRLYEATRRGDLREMRELLAHAAATGLTHRAVGFPQQCYAAPALRWQFFARSTANPVHVAASLGNLRALELLAAYGFDLTALDKAQRVVLSTGGLFWQFLRVLVQRPAGSDAESAESIFHTTLVTPLHCAVATGQLATVRWLLERGVPPGTLSQASFRSKRIPPLFLAEHAEIARELLLHGADPLVIPDPGHMNTITPVQLAFMRGNFAVARELEEWGGDVALTPFHLAAARNDVAAVRRFVAWKTDVNCLGEMGYVGLNRRTPLHWAAISGATGAVEALLAGRADPNFQDVRGRSPLHWAAQLNKLDVVRSLLRAKADPNLLDGDLKTPLMCAASARNVSRELFRELTSAGGDIGYQLPTTGDTVLHVAVREENEASALAALACGADLMRMNKEGLRPLDCTLSTRLLFGLKRAAGQRDVMISYTHSHQEFALKLRQSLEEANVTTWLDLMDPSGIGGGAVWREEIARGITNASVVLCILTEDYAASEWCLKELALAKQVGTPILAVSTEGASIDEDLQVYLYTRQIVPFEPAITGVRCDEGRVEYDYDDSRYRFQFHLLLDGVRDEVEKHRYVTRRKNVASRRRPDLGMEYESSSNRGTMLQTFSATQLSQGTDSCSLTTPSVSYGRRFVFLSHGDKHAPFVRQLASQLTDGGIACYSDQNRSGQDFNTRIQGAQEAIMHCSCFIVLVSRQTIGNELVRDQLAFAEDKGRPIFPVVLNDLEPGLDKLYTLVRSELFHFMANGAGFNASCSKLMSDLRQYCDVVEAVGSFGGSESEEVRNLWTPLKSSRKT